MKTVYKVKKCDLKSHIRPFSVQKSVDIQNQRKLLDRIIASLKLKDKSDLYNITAKVTVFTSSFNNHRQ